MPKLYAGLTILEILGIAVKKEIEAAEFYDGLASRIANPIIKDRFLQLAKDERKHHALLQHEYQRLTGESKPLLPKADPVSRAEFNVQSATIEEALLYAIQTERAAQKLYGVAAKASTDPRGQQMLEYLVEFEKAHEHQLKTELEFYRKSPLWFDETEDFIHVGP
jgi:rubrerythrin